MIIREADGVGMDIFLKWLREDPVANIFAIYDLIYQRKNSTAYFAWGDQKVHGYLLLYDGLSYPVAILRTEDEKAATLLLEKVPSRKMVMFTDVQVLDLIKERHNVSFVAKEDLMVTDGRRISQSEKYAARRITPADAEKVSELYSRGRLDEETPHSHEKWIQQHVVYGVDGKDGRSLSSVGGTWIESKEGWMLGGIYTSPQSRGKGFATAVTSALTREAVKHASIAALFVVSSNKPAIKVYEKVGYSKAGERLWIDLGTGIKPLGSESL